MIQTTGLTGHMSFPSFTVSATLQKRPGSNVSVEKPPTLKYLLPSNFRQCTLPVGECARPSAEFAHRPLLLSVYAPSYFPSVLNTDLADIVFRPVSQETSCVFYTASAPPAGPKFRESSGSRCAWLENPLAQHPAESPTSDIPAPRHIRPLPSSAA